MRMLKKVKRKKNGFFFQRDSTSWFCLNTKIFYQNYFYMRNNYNR